MKIHFIGIGGEGMIGVAKLALAQGHQVSGSERATKRGLPELRRLGATVYRVHRPENIEGVELIVRSSAIPLQHIEVQEAQLRRIPYIKRSECLGMLLSEKNVLVIGVAGTHGKSTTTAMLGQVLETAGLDPTVIVGAYVPHFRSHARIGRGKYAVVEADEFDRSFLDIRAHSGIVTSIKLDHLDYYQGGIEEITSAFVSFVQGFDSERGMLVACSDDEIVSKILLRQWSGAKRTYGLQESEWLVRPISGRGAPSSFDVVTTSRTHSFSLGVTGIHNIQNAGAVIAMSDFLSIPIKVVQEAFANFKGISRRYEKLLVSHRLVFIDDFGHLPHEIEAVLMTVRQEFRGWFILCVPCLRQYHRTRQRLGEFAKACAMADRCIVAPISPGLGDNEATVRQVSSLDLAEAIRKLGCEASGHKVKKNTVQEILTVCATLLQNNNVVVLTIGTGSQNMSTVTNPLRRGLRAL